MPLLSIDQLRDKSLPGMKDVLHVSFEYLVASIAQEYSKVNRYSTIQEFNKKNRLTVPKTLVYPFFVSLSNGNSESLYNLYGDFYSLSYGPVSFNLFSMIKSAPETKYFRYYSEINPLGIEVLLGNENDKPGLCFDQIKNNIKDTSINLLGFECRFDEIQVLNDEKVEKNLYSAIDSGIKAMKIQSPGFFNADPEAMTLHATYFNAYNNRHSTNDVSIIEFKELEKPKDRPFYKDEKSLENI